MVRDCRRTRLDHVNERVPPWHLQSRHRFYLCDFCLKKLLTLLVICSATLFTRNFRFAFGLIVPSFSFTAFFECGVRASRAAETTSALATQFPGRLFRNVFLNRLFAVRMAALSMLTGTDDDVLGRSGEHVGAILGCFFAAYATRRFLLTAVRFC